MRFDHSRLARLGFALLFGLGLFGCRAPMHPPTATAQVPGRTRLGVADADLAAWADLQAARAEWLAARQELEAVKLELGRAKGRVETMRQKLASLDGDLAEDGEVRREKPQALEASLEREKR